MAWLDSRVAGSDKLRFPQPDVFEDDLPLSFAFSHGPDCRHLHSFLADVRQEPLSEVIVCCEIDRLCVVRFFADGGLAFFSLLELTSGTQSLPNDRLGEDQSAGG